MISFSSKGDFSNLEKFLAAMKRKKYLDILKDYGEIGVEALASMTPKKTGTTAASWTYEIEQSLGSSTISWSNTNEHDGVNIAVILQYGHGTGTGGYVTGIDYINPAMKPIFEAIADAAWKEVQSS